MHSTHAEAIFLFPFYPLFLLQYIYGQYSLQSVRIHHFVAKKITLNFNLLIDFVKDIPYTIFRRECTLMPTDNYIHSYNYYQALKSVTFREVVNMTVDQAVKKFKLEPLNVYTAKAKAKELNVDEVLYMNVQKNKYAYVVKDGPRGYMLYQDEKSLYTKMYKGLKMTPLEP